MKQNENSNPTEDIVDKQYKKMIETPIPKLILMLGIPTTISMLVTNVYNIADSYFVSQLSLSAGGATSVVFGIMSVIQAVGYMFGHGAGSHISRLLGAKEIKKAHTYASTSFFTSIVCGIIMMLIGLIFLEPLMLLLGSTPTILPYAKSYATWIFIATPAMTSSCVLNNILRYEGKASLAMIGLSTGGILNIILDPIFIFGFNMGISGAGLATAISQYVSLGILLTMFLLKKSQSHISIRYMSNKWKTYSSIIMTGLPSLARQGLNGVSTMVLNTQAKAFEDAAIAAMGYVGRTSSFIFCVGLGIGQGFQPLCGFNYGAKKYSRVKKGAYFTLGFGTAVLGTIAAACFAFAPQIISLFRPEAEVIALGSEALRIYCIFLLFLPISMVGTVIFQSIGKNYRALLLSCLQSGAIFIPLCIVLPIFFSIKGIETAQPLAYFLSATVSLPMTIAFLRRLPKDE